MRKIAASYIFPISRAPVKNGILICEDDGTIVDLIQKGDSLREEAGLEFYSGILAPGFVNAHCHLELSHLKSQIEEKSGIGRFIGKINELRNADSEAVEKAMKVADRKMWAAGIRAVGDISNSTASLEIKSKSKLIYHTFVEAFGFHPSRAEKAVQYARQVQGEFHQNQLAASVVPHSPYSVSEQLFKKIKHHAETEKSILSIHNQESRGESEFYEKGSGAIARHLQDNLGIDISHWKASGKSSLQSVLMYFPVENRLLLVHNTFTQKQDLEFLRVHRKLENTFFVLCPNSNQYIENTLPPVTLFRNQGLNICLGTDSLASNHQLSMLSEMQSLQKAFPEINLEEILNWATLNGAKALDLDDNLGTFERGKNPGVNLITGIDFTKMQITSNSKVKRLV